MAKDGSTGNTRVSRPAIGLPNHARAFAGGCHSARYFDGGGWDGWCREARL